MVFFEVCSQKVKQSEAFSLFTKCLTSEVFESSAVRHKCFVYEVELIAHIATLVSLKEYTNNSNLQ